MSEVEIRALNASPETIAMLSEILVETVAHGGSVSFMHPLAPGSARAFWDERAGGGGARRADRCGRL